jgi:hypothetical protein
MARQRSDGPDTAATRDDITEILGEIEADKLLAILSLQPTIADLETASVWLAGDDDVFGSGHPVKGTASDIISILVEGEEDEPPPAA